MAPPPHRNEKVFRSYEPHIFQLLLNWPEPTTFRPTSVATSTFTARLRDSIASIIEFQWPTSIDVERLKQLRQTNQLEIIPQGNLVFARLRVGRSKAAILAETVKEVVLVDEFSGEMDSPDELVLRAAATLLAMKVLVKPIKITNLDFDLQKLIEENYDVAFSTQDSYIIML